MFSFFRSLFRRPAPIVRSGSRRQASTVQRPSTKVGLTPRQGWARRNFLVDVLLPSLFRAREGKLNQVVLPQLKPGQLSITWIGHASFLIRTPHRNILIDPNWARWLKVIKRLRQPGMNLHDLPSIDLVLVSHAHFDHLDKRTLRAVAADQPIVVPLGVGNLVHRLGFKQVHELETWHSYEDDDVKVTLTPCHHWGARVLHDAHRGFGGFVIEFGGHTIYHCGDSAYFDGFRSIGEHFSIDYALMPIGAYDPPSGRSVHMTPEEVVRAFLELGAKTLVPMHYGSFRLSFEPVNEPLSRLWVASELAGIADRIMILLEGEIQVLGEET